MTSAFETWKCEAWCLYLSAYALNPWIHRIGNAWYLLRARCPKIMWHVAARSDACVLSAAAPRKLKTCTAVLMVWLLIQWEHLNGPKQMLEPIQIPPVKWTNRLIDNRSSPRVAVDHGSLRGWSRGTWHSEVVSRGQSWVVVSICFNHFLFSKPIWDDPS